MILVSLLTVSAVSANEINSTEDIVSEEIAVDDNLEVTQEDTISTTHKVTGNTFEDIQNAVNSAKDGDTIELSGTYTKNDQVISIDKSLTIRGIGETNIDANQSRKGIFLISNGNTKIINLFLLNCKSMGAINANSGASYVCLNCTFINNTASYSGGAISYGDAVNCIFINNSASGTASELYGGAIYYGDAVNCTFVGNSALYGGAIYEGNSVNCTFIGNSARYGGGAIYNGNATNCTFISNSDDISGAIDSGNAVNCIFINNTDRAIWGGDAVNCTFINNTVSDHDDGGAIHGGNAVNCTFIGNSATRCGGAIAYGDAVNCTFIGNSAIIDGGAIDSGNAVNCTFIGNSAAEVGGAIYGGDAETCKFINNSASEDDAISSGDAMYCFFEGNERPDSWYFYCHGAFTLTQNGQYYKNKYLSIKLIDTDSNLPLAGEEITIKFSNGKSAVVSTNSQGVASYSIPFEPGTYSASVSLDNNHITIDDAKLDNIVVNKIPGSLKVVSSGNYYSDVNLTLTLTNLNSNTPISSEKIEIKFSNGKSAVVSTNSQGVASYSIPFEPGTYSLTAEILSDNYDVNSQKLANIKIVKASAALTPTKLSTTYGSGKYFQVKVVNSKTKNAMSNVKLTLKVYTGKKYKTVTVTSNSKGIAKYSASTLALGTHKIVVNVKDTKYISAKSKSSSVKISKATLKISAPKVTNQYKQSEFFRVTVKNKESGKAMSGVKVTIKVYTGNKYKTFTAKTNGDGVASFSTKSLSKTTHKVIVNVGGNSKIKSSSTKSSISIIRLRLDTQFELKSIISVNDLAGLLDYVSIEVKLVNSNGAALSGKYVSAQLKNVDLQRRLWDASDKDTSHTSSDGSAYFILYKYSGYNSSNRYVEVSFSGDENYNGCTRNFYF